MKVFYQCEAKSILCPVRSNLSEGKDASEYPYFLSLHSIHPTQPLCDSCGAVLSLSNCSNNFCQELSGIPIFFDFVAPINSDSKQSSLSLSDSNEIYTDTEAIVNEQLEICESMQLSTTERQIVYAQSPFYQTLERAEKIIADGGLVKGIHFLFPIAENGSDLSVSTILSSNDWRDYTMPLRTYNGYELSKLNIPLSVQTLR